MGALKGRIAIITGAGRGIGREHALLMAEEGAHIVVNDLGGASDGAGTDTTPAEAVAREIVALGGVATASAHDVADWDGARLLVESTVETFGGLDVLVNNAGILRDRTIVGMTETDWDSVLHVHLKGHLAPLHFAALHWRKLSKAGTEVRASVVNTTSTSGLLAHPGQGNYGAAKSGIATLTQIAAKELDRYGVRVNAIAPGARTRLTVTVPAIAELMQAPADDRFDEWHPGNVSPLVAWLATRDCTVSGRVLFVQGGRVAMMRSWSLGAQTDGNRRWTLPDLDEAMAQVLEEEAAADTEVRTL